MADTSIEWATKVWNPLRGCSKVSEGCRNCYAIRQAHRFSGKGMPYHGLTKETPNGPNWTGKVMMVPDKLGEPLKWRKPQRVFVNSMSDLFHQEVPQWYIDQIFGYMLANHVLDRQAKHTFMVLTKRPERMNSYFAAGAKALIQRWSKALDGVVIMDDADVLFSEYVFGFEQDYLWPLPNVWLGVSVENQKAANERIHLLNNTPAAIRFLSCEPLLGPLKLNVHLHWKSSRDWKTPLINWVIVGGESGHGARPMHPVWVRDIRDQCQTAGVPFFFKQWGEWSSETVDKLRPPGFVSPSGKWELIQPFGWGADNPGSVSVWRVGKNASGRLLDGREWNEYPEPAQ